MIQNLCIYDLFNRKLFGALEVKNIEASFFSSFQI